MTRPYGSRGRDRSGDDDEARGSRRSGSSRPSTPSSRSSQRPGRPSSSSSRRRIDFDDDEFEDEDEPEELVSDEPPRRRSAPQTAPAPQTETSKIDPQKRAVALMCDIIVAFMISLMLASVVSIISKVIPTLERIFSNQTLFAMMFLARDFLYEGRGVGKNLMGLRVVDVYTGNQPSLLQSVKRNIIFFVPIIVTEVVKITLTFVHAPVVNSVIVQAVNLACMVYVLVLLPAECWFAYSKEDGRRIGDRIAGTHIVESHMNFSKPL
ncbi:MAG: RDD family protein [Cyanobacteria bacterium]|nr:RDD family protein [Cyanobacteriota bacterium]